MFTEYGSVRLFHNYTVYWLHSKSNDKALNQNNKNSASINNTNQLNQNLIGVRIDVLLFVDQSACTSGEVKQVSIIVVIYTFNASVAATV